MTRIELTSRVGADGVLNVKVPVGMADANRKVVVTVQPADEERRDAEFDQGEWRRFVAETAGKWVGELERPEQGEFEKREPWG